MFKLGYRERDKAPLGLIELVDSPFEYKKALSFFESEKISQKMPFYQHPPTTQPSTSQRTKMALKGLLPKTHNCYDYQPVARQYLINHLNLQDRNLEEMGKQRKSYLNGKLLEIYRRECVPKYKPGWSLPMKTPSFIQSVLTASSETILKIRPKIIN